MEILLIIAIVAIPLCVEAYQKHEANKFSDWVDKNYPYQGGSISDHVERAKRLYDSRKK